jgi:hypothetical protein
LKIPLVSYKYLPEMECREHGPAIRPHYDRSDPNLAVARDSLLVVLDG